MASEAVRSFDAPRHAGPLSPQLTGLLSRGDAATADELRAARARASRAAAEASARLAGLDALLTPSAPGEAPEGLESTGDPVFNRVVTLLGLPALGLPAGNGPSGLPLGIQLVGARAGDAALLGTGAWVEPRLRAIPG